MAYTIWMAVAYPGKDASSDDWVELTTAYASLEEAEEAVTEYIEDDHSTSGIDDAGKPCTVGYLISARHGTYYDVDGNKVEAFPRVKYAAGYPTTDSMYNENIWAVMHAAE